MCLFFCFSDENDWCAASCTHLKQKSTLFLTLFRFYNSYHYFYNRLTWVRYYQCFLCIVGMHSRPVHTLPKLGFGSAHVRLPVVPYTLHSQIPSLHGLSHHWSSAVWGTLLLIPALMNYIKKKCTLLFHKNLLFSFLFLFQGISVIFNVALALLKVRRCSWYHWLHNFLSCFTIETWIYCTVLCYFLKMNLFFTHAWSQIVTAVKEQVIILCPPQLI